MDIAVTISKRDYQNVLTKYVLNKYFSATRLIIIFIMFLLIGIQIGTYNSYKILFLLFIYPFSGLILYSIYFSTRFWIPFLKFKRILGPNTFNASYTITNNKDSLSFVTVKGEKKIFWRQVITIKQLNDFLIISLLDNSIYILPGDLFNDNESIKEFVQSIQDGILKVRGTLKVPLFLRPPYLLGIFCFIPILGFFVGIVLILLGIFQYKDKLLVVLGSLGIIFTIVLYSVLFPELWSKKETDKQFAGLSKTLLNSLVRDIEYYKLQNGKYPERLEQLQSSNPMVIIHDPLQAGNKANSKYNYILVGDKYRLFSSGIDRVPNTKDDIFPDIQDSSKVGFIK
jgi:hypothetical protein